MIYLNGVITKIKYWTINCSLLDDEEFEVIVQDIERFIQTRRDGGTLPQKESEQWLQNFVDEYSCWRGRRFLQNRYPLETYFRIDTRVGSIENEHQVIHLNEQVA